MISMIGSRSERQTGKEARTQYFWGDFAAMPRSPLLSRWYPEHCDQLERQARKLEMIPAMREQGMSVLVGTVAWTADRCIGTRASPRPHFRLTAGQTILRARNSGNAAAAHDESGETMSTEEKPSRNEHEYFVKRDAELILERRARLDQERRNQERSSHFNKCPRCGIDLEERDHNGVKIDQCDNCGGMWLDKGELGIIEELDRHSPGFMHNLLGFIRR